MGAVLAAECERARAWASLGLDGELSQVEQVLLRKDVLGVRRLAASLMPSFAEGLKPADVADLLAWLRSNLGAAVPTPKGAKVK